MPQNSNIAYILGNESVESNIDGITALPIFSDEALSFLELVSKKILSDEESKEFSDVVTFGFWCRKSSLQKMALPYKKNLCSLGRGIVFHIAPSNVAVNFAYSCVAALLAGNASIIRLPSKSFRQVDIICRIFKQAIAEQPNMEGFFLFVRYGHDKAINDKYSFICDTRVIWGGDNTIDELRKSPMKARANEITFADRHSFAIIGADEYLETENKDRIAQDFFNDTYLTDQNACTSPRIVIWLGNNISQAQNIFWQKLYDYANRKYELQPVQAVDKITNLYKMAAELNIDIKMVNTEDNLITRVEVSALLDTLMDYKMNSGFFMEYIATDIKEVIALCDSRCQTVSYYGINAECIKNVVTEYRPQGVDRIVPIGRTMDFSLIWDGYDLIRAMSRIVGKE